MAAGKAFAALTCTNDNTTCAACLQAAQAIRRCAGGVVAGGGQANGAAWAWMQALTFGGHRSRRAAHGLIQQGHAIAVASGSGAGAPLTLQRLQGWTCHLSHRPRGLIRQLDYCSRLLQAHAMPQLWRFGRSVKKCWTAQRRASQGGMVRRSGCRRSSVRNAGAAGRQAGPRGAAPPRAKAGASEAGGAGAQGQPLLTLHCCCTTLLKSSRALSQQALLLTCCSHAEPWPQLPWHQAALAAAGGRFADTLAAQEGATTGNSQATEA